MRFMLVALSAGLFFLAYPNSIVLHGVPFTGWLFAIPFFFAIENRRWPVRAGLGFLWGVLAQAGVLWWMPQLGLHGYAGHGTYVISLCWMALQGAIFAGFFSASVPRRSMVLYIPSAWVLSEYLRNATFGGFTWSLGYSQAFIPELMQAARWGGVYLVSWLMILVSAGAYTFFKAGSGSRFLGVGVVFVGPLLLWFAGAAAISCDRPPVFPAVRIAAIQPDRYDLGVGQRSDTDMPRLMALTRAAVGRAQPQLIVWPETALQNDILNDALWRPRLEGLARELGTDMLLGSYLTMENGFESNAFLLLTAGGQWKDVYFKRTLIPVIERPFGGPFTPWALRTFHLRVGWIVPGERSGVMLLKSVPHRVGVSLCSEQEYPVLFRGMVSRGAEILLVGTNEGFVDSRPLIMTQAMIGITRAVEAGRPIVRAANTGWTLAADARGRLLPGSPPIQKEGFGVFNIVPRQEKTFYMMFGDLFVALCGVFVIIILLSQRRSPGSTEPQNIAALRMVSRLSL